MGKLVLGLDIGITSVGYGIVDIDENRFVDYGVRLFKEGTAANNEDRRVKRGARRLKRRQKNRINDMKNLLEKEGILNKDYKVLNNPYEIRVKGLSHELSNDELVCALLHITKHRGSSLETSADEVKDDEVMKNVLNNNQKLLSDGKYICQVQLQRLKEEGKVRGFNNNFKTDDYIKEVTQILSCQNISKETSQKIIDIIKRKRAYYEGPGSEKSPTPYGRWIDFGVEPIDLIEKMRGKCSVCPDQLRAPKNSYSAELFNLLNDLNNLSINHEKITIDQKKDIIEFVKEKGNITIKQLCKILDVDIENISGFRIDKNEKPLLTEFKGFKKVKKVFDEYQNIDYLNDTDIVDDIIDVLTKSKGVEERKNTLKEKYPHYSDQLLLDLSKIKGISQYHSLSFKALRMLNKEMVTSELNQMQLLHELDLFDKNRKSTKGQKRIYADDEAILSPVAKRAQRETFKVVNKLREIYGEFDSIVIETTRDKNTNEQKKRIGDIQKYYENQNKEVNKLLKEKGFNPETINNKTKLKIRLYLEQDCKSAYTLKQIDLNTLIYDENAYEIDHIIPISVSLDDSINNKVLATHNENQAKGNLTPIDAYLKGKFNDMGCNIDEYKSVVLTNKKINRKKKNYLLYEKDITKFTNIQDFIARNLVDTSYANRVVMNTLSHYFKDNNIPTKVHTIKGSATNVFRKRINLEKDREQDYMHHAIDALIVASIKKLNLLNTYLGKYNINELYNEETGEVFPVGEDKELLDSKYIEFIQNLKAIHEESYRYYNGLIQKEKMQFKPIKISHKIDTKANRQISDETIYSTRKVEDKDMVVKKYSDIHDPKFDKLTNDIINNDNLERWLMYKNDPQTFQIIQDIILNHFNTYKKDKDIYSKKEKKGKVIYNLKGSNNPLAEYKKEHGKVRKYSKKNNGPEVTMMKYTDGQFNSGIDISNNYQSENKKVVLLQVSPYRTDFYVSPEGKYNFVTVRYKDVFYKKSINKYTIDKEWYKKQKEKKKIKDDWKFVCSLHHDELIGVMKKEGSTYVYDLSTEEDGYTRYYDNDIEILKFTATNNDDKGIFEVKPIYTYCKTRLKISVGTLIEIKKYATDVLGNLYEVKDNVLKFEWD